MCRWLHRVSVLALLLVVVAGIGVAAPTIAQDATPVSAESVTCDVESRSANELLELWYGDTDDPDATPIATRADMDEEFPDEVTLQLGEPADEETTAGVAETLLRVFACFHEGDVLRAYALFTDDMAQVFGPPPGTPREQGEAFLRGEFGVEDGTELLTVANVMLLDDGRAAAFVVERDASGDSVAYVIFEVVGDRWLVDDLIDFPREFPDDEA